MKCFDVVKTVLDASYGEIDDTDGKRDQRIRTAIKASRDRYLGGLMENGGPDFSDAATRFGYVYSYVPAHGHWVFDLIDRSPEAKAFMASGKVRLTCIGGGPGSDIVGALKYLDENDLDCKLFVEIIDGCPQWKGTWSDLAYTLDLDNALHTDYVIHDVGDPSTWASPSNIHKADIVTLSFFVSEIFHLGDAAKKYLADMLSRIKQGAVVLVIDNRTQALYEMLDGLAADAGLTTKSAWEGDQKIYDSGEQLAVLKEYKERLGASSKLTGTVFHRIYVKA